MNISSFDELLCKIGIHKWTRTIVDIIDADPHDPDYFPNTEACCCKRCGKIKLKCNDVKFTLNDWEDIPNIPIFRKELNERL